MVSSWSTCHLCAKFCENQPSSFGIILLINKQAPIKTASLVEQATGYDWPWLPLVNFQYMIMSVYIYKCGYKFFIFVFFLFLHFGNLIVFTQISGSTYGTVECTNRTPSGDANVCVFPQQTSDAVLAMRWLSAIITLAF